MKEEIEGKDYVALGRFGSSKEESLRLQKELAEGRWDFAKHGKIPDHFWRPATRKDRVILSLSKWLRRWLWKKN